MLRYAPEINITVYQSSRLETLNKFFKQVDINAKYKSCHDVNTSQWDPEFKSFWQMFIGCVDNDFNNGRGKSLCVSIVQ